MYIVQPKSLKRYKAVSTKLGKITDCQFMIYITLAEGPSIARREKLIKKKFRIFLKPNTCRLPATHECPQQISAQSIQPFGRL